MGTCAEDGSLKHGMGCTQRCPLSYIVQGRQPRCHLGKLVAPNQPVVCVLPNCTCYGEGARYSHAWKVRPACTLLRRRPRP